MILFRYKITCVKYLNFTTCWNIVYTQIDCWLWFTNDHKEFKTPTTKKVKTNSYSYKVVGNCEIESFICMNICINKKGMW